MLRALDLFPFEAPPNSGLPIQGRIVLRRAQFLLTVPDVKDFIITGRIKPTDDPDQAQWISANGF